VTEIRTCIHITEAIQNKKELTPLLPKYNTMLYA